MRRFFTIIEGEGKGRCRELDQPLMIIGRSRNADFQIEDPLVSRRHLEIRVEPDAVFIEDKSTHGTLLNGQRLNGIVSLSPGDIIEMGQVKLRYEERETSPAASPPPLDESAEPRSSRLDGTRVQVPGETGEPPGKENPADHTRALQLDHTRMADPSELPRWKSLDTEHKEARPARMLWLALSLFTLVGAVGAAWFILLGPPGPGPPADTGEFKDDVLGYTINYPRDWVTLAHTAGEVIFGVRKTNGVNWASVRVHADRHPSHAITGLTYGFEQYLDTLRTQFPAFKLNESFRWRIEREPPMESLTVIVFRFSTPELLGKGIYLLNADTRIIVVCCSPPAVYGRYNPIFSDVLASLRLLTGEPQQFIDFPLPDETLRLQGLTNRQELELQVTKRLELANAFLQSGEFRKAILECQEALKLTIAPPNPIENQYQRAAQLLKDASMLLEKEIRRQLANMEIAKQRAEPQVAEEAAYAILRIAPEDHPAYAQAREMLERLGRRQ